MNIKYITFIVHSDTFSSWWPNYYEKIEISIIIMKQ